MRDAPSIPSLPLTPSQKRFRLFALLFVLCFYSYAYLMTPERMKSSWSPPEIMSLIGLPCLLCGGTRATHFLLHGDIQRALYFNWIALPALACAVGFVVVMSLELAQRRRLVPTIVPSRTQVTALAVVALSLWAHHIYDALSSPKPELLNRDGLYFLLAANNSNTEATQ